MKKIIYYMSFVVVIIAFKQVCATTPHVNLFNPYDRMVLPPDRPCMCWQVWAGFEGLISQRSFQAEEDEFGNSNCFRKRADVLQLYQDEQDLLAALKGDDFLAQASQVGQQFNIDDDNGTEGLFIPQGRFEMLNFWFSVRRYLSHGFSVSAHLPVVKYALKDVVWNPSPRNSNTSFDSQTTNDFVAMIEKVGNINLYDWSRAGIGDISGIVWWAQNFPQGRPFLHNVYLGFRTGLVFPTGKHTDENVMLGLPFGYDAGTGILFGGTLELSYFDYALLGIDAEFLALFGETRQRRIKTDLAQTDLVFLTKVNTFVEPGFIQHFTLYGKLDRFCGGISLGAAYQYTKQLESKIYLGSNHFNPVIANTAEELQDWTNHSAIFTATFDFFNGDYDPYKPWIEVFYKHGFNGSRSIAADTLGVVVAIDF